MAKSWSLGWRTASPVRAFIKVVFPEETKGGTCSAVVHCSCASFSSSAPVAGSHRSWCIPALKPQESDIVGAVTSAVSSSSSVSPRPSGSSSLSPSADVAGPPTASHLQTPVTASHPGTTPAPPPQFEWWVETHLNLRCTWPRCPAGPCPQTHFLNVTCRDTRRKRGSVRGERGRGLLHPPLLPQKVFEPQQRNLSQRDL